MGVAVNRFRERDWTTYEVDVSEESATTFAREVMNPRVFTGTVEDVDLLPESLDLISVI